MAHLNRSKPFRSATFSHLKNERFTGFKDLPQPSGFSLGVAASAQWLAAGYGSKSNLIVLPVDYSQYKRSAQPSLISGSSGDLNDFQFSPLADSLVATGDGGGLVKLWEIPTGGLTGNIATPQITIEDSFDFIHSVRFHPTTSNLLAVGAKSGAALLDCQAGKAIFRFQTEGFGKDIVNLAWNRDGSLMATLGKNNNITAFDPRTAQAALLVGGGATTPSVKKTHQILFTGGAGAQSSQMLLFGLSSGQRPLIQFFDPRSLASPTLEKDLEFTSGFLLPAYDLDTNQLFVTVRGSSLIQMFDVEQEKNRPAAVASSSFSCDASIKGLGLVGKRGVNTNDTEVNRLVVLGTDSIEGISVRVPRKINGFHEDLYPNTAKAEAAQTVESYLKGENAQPSLISMTDVHLGRGGGKIVVQEKFDPLKDTVAAKATKVSIDDNEEEEKKAAEAAAAATRPTSNSNAQKFVYSSNSRANLESKLKTSIYRHTGVREPPEIHNTYYDIKLTTSSLPSAENIRANGRYFAVPWNVSGGSAIALYEIGKLGRTKVNFPLIKGHKSPATTFDLSVRPGQQNFFASASWDGDIRLFEIPEGGLQKDLMEERLLMLADGKVSMLRFHPFIDNILVSAVAAFGDHSLQFWDCRNGEKKIEIVNCGHTDAITDFSLNGNGHLIATTCKDGKARVINIATKALVKEFSIPEGVRESRVIWVSENSLITIGFGAGSVRTVSYWQVDGDCSKPSGQIELERINNVPIPRYDEDSRLLFIGNYGGTFLQTIQVKSESPFLECLDILSTKADCTGFVFLPKSSVDEKKVEILRSLKLTKDAVHPLTHTVPRKRLEFFQDDLYPLTRDFTQELMTADEFFNGKFPQGVEPQRISLNRSALTPLSQAPEEELTERQQRYQQKNRVSDAPKPVGALGHSNSEEVRSHFMNVAKTITGSNRWDAKVDNSRVDVDEDEWD